MSTIHGVSTLDPIYAKCGDSGMKWAEEFCATAKRLYNVDLDQGWVCGWFANAIEHSHDLRTGNLPVVLPDGSSFFVGSIGDRS